MPDLDRWENEGGQTVRKPSQARLKALQRRHMSLDQRLDQELGRPNPCSLELQRLKREKLYLKDEINQFSR
jgi:hypothetical protein